jgi:opacity protein-like surface antigen
LFYVSGGGAWANTTFSLSGNTQTFSLGTGSKTMDARGWTAGTGLEYALTDHWDDKL